MSNKIGGEKGAVQNRIIKYVREPHAEFIDSRGRRILIKLGWEYVPSAQLDRLRDSYDNPFIIPYLKEAIVKLNSYKGITEEHADAIIRKLQRIESNEEFSKWLKGEQSFKPSQSENAVTIRLIDAENLENNRFIVTKS